VIRGGPAFMTASNPPRKAGLGLRVAAANGEDPSDLLLLSRPHLSFTLFVGDGDRRLSTEVRADSFSLSELHSKRCLTMFDPLSRESEAVGALSADLAGEVRDGFTQKGRISESSVLASERGAAVGLSETVTAAAAAGGSWESKEPIRGDRLRGETGGLAERSSLDSRNPSSDLPGDEGVTSREVSTSVSVAFLSAGRGDDGASDFKKGEAAIDPPVRLETGFVGESGDVFFSSKNGRPSEGSLAGTETAEGASPLPDSA
jgi:hypothetical protein